MVKVNVESVGLRFNMNNFWCITTFFNPAGYKTIVDNYNVFSSKLNANLLTVEVSFDGKFYLNDSVKINAKDVMWMKERLINYACSLLPSNCDMFAWIDADIIFADPDWQHKAIQKLKHNDIIQLFKRVFYLPQGHTSYQGEQLITFPGVVYQKNCYENWLEKRRNREIGFGAPGFAWAARRTAFQNGIYDRDIAGSGDCVLVDCLLDTWDLHGYDIKYNQFMKNDIENWCSKVQNLTTTYLPVDVFHLWHGNINNRAYLKRHKTFNDNDFNPNEDIKINGPVFEWNSSKPDLHKDVKNYFYARQEDLN